VEKLIPAGLRFFDSGRDKAVMILDSAHAGSVCAGSRVMAKAWQRQPPQSISLRSQERQGSGIQSVPRKA